jgi:MFS family permease
MAAYRRLLRNRPFALLWVGATISILGDALTWVSLVWLTAELGGTAFDIGLLAVCYTAPVVVGGLVAGVLLDRFDRRRLLIADNAIRGLAMLSIPIASALGVLQPIQLDAVALVYGLLYMISLAGFPSLLPELVPAEDLATANAMESMSFGFGGVVGPALAGILIGVVGAAANLAIDAVTYGAFVVCLLALRLPVREAAPAVERAAGADAGAARDRGLGPAIGFIRRSPAILAITVMFMAANVGEGMLAVFLPVFARDILHAGAAGYGLLVSALTAGSLVGSVVVGGIHWGWPLGRSIAAAQLAFGAGVLAMIALPPLALAAAILAFVGVCGSPLTIWAQTIRMRLIPEELRGRVFALLRTLMQSTPPVGGLAAGILLAGGAASAVAAIVAVVIGLPGAIGLVHPALSSRWTGVSSAAPNEGVAS